LLQEILRNNEPSSPDEILPPAPAKRNCVGAVCYPGGLPQSFPDGSVEQMQAICMITDRKTGRRAVPGNYATTAQCVDHLYRMAVAQASKNLDRSNFGPSPTGSNPLSSATGVSRPATPTGTNLDRSNFGPTAEQGSVCAKGWQSAMQCKGVWRTENVFDVVCTNSLAGSAIAARICQTDGTACHDTWIPGDGVAYLAHNNLGLRQYSPSGVACKDARN
jgi:hypothetical protein